MTEEQPSDKPHQRGRRRPLLKMPPGSIMAPPDTVKPTIRVLAYNADQFVQVTIEHPRDLLPLLDQWSVVWIDVDGIGDTDTMRSLAEVLHLHPLAVEDVLDLSQRPKMEPYDDQVFVVMRELLAHDPLHSEQFSMFVGKNYVLTFQESPGDALDPVRERIRGGRGRMRSRTAAYLAYSLIDAVLDGYFPVLESYGDRLVDLEDEVLGEPDPYLVRKIHRIRRDLMTVRRAVWPLRDVIHELEQDDTLMDSETRVYLRDSYDHAVRIMDLVETHREVASSLMDLYLSNVNNRMNEVIKVLTIISTIFMPLSFIAGVYGMNFDPDASPWNMPELRWRFGYVMALGIMLGTALVLLGIFARRGWLSSRSSVRRRLRQKRIDDRDQAA